MREAAQRPLRADAARNRARLLDPATEVFADRGVGVPTAEAEPAGAFFAGFRLVVERSAGK
ncbi:hypothetical protein ABT247_25755 [Kitasatospora sp. NPDC001539]|uniref:hypothetical protein n=1 Tax=Kitasatospora sp. NPDC001539 TaxID=3154384 RepID=UPI0033338EDE